MVRSQFADRGAEKRKFGEKTKRSKKKLQKQGKALSKAKPKYRLEKAYTMASCSFSSSSSCRRSARLKENVDKPRHRLDREKARPLVPRAEENV